MNSTERFSTPLGFMDVEHIGHACVKLTLENGYTIYTDPYSEVADFSGRPKANLILISHDHYDHYDPKALVHIVDEKTSFITAPAISGLLHRDGFNNNVKELANGENCFVSGNFGLIGIKAVTAYNINQKNPDGNPFHPKGYGNGYVITLMNEPEKESEDDFVIYFAGDSEFIPEMSNTESGIPHEADIAFLPKNLPYTMSDEAFVQAANTLMPKALFPIHYFELDMDYLRKNINPAIELY